MGSDATPLRTFTVTLPLPVLPAASRTDAVSTRMPSATILVFHAIIIREAQIDEIPRLAHEFGVRSFKTFMA